MAKSSLGARFMAIVADSLIVYILGLIVGAIIGRTVLGIGVGFLVGLVYNWYFWTRNNGQTPAKSFMGIRVVKTNGSRLTDLDAVVRYIGYYISGFVLGLGYLWAFIDADKQAWHDKLAGTYVVRA
ncbi:MAG TPA: RDD family protein [Aggregatilineaceae bacterium]|nr:RDD family protein [Aggregatilineaceae bacterium]